MANSTSVTIEEDGPKNTVLKFSGTLDTSDLASTLVINAASEYRDPAFDGSLVYRIDKIDYDVDGPLSVQLYWGGVPTRFASVSGWGILDFGKKYGGLQNDESLVVRDGRILATTTGYVAGTITFTLVLWLVKQSFISIAAPVGRITGDSDSRITGDGDRRIVYA